MVISQWSIATSGPLARRPDAPGPRDDDARCHRVGGGVVDRTVRTHDGHRPWRSRCAWPRPRRRARDQVVDVLARAAGGRLTVRRARAADLPALVGLIADDPVSADGATPSTTS